MKLFIINTLAATALFTPTSHAGGTLKAEGWRPPFINMQQMDKFAWSYGPNDSGMAIWNEYADLFRKIPSDGEWGKNNVSEYGGFPSQADLSATWGFNWGGALALTCIMWNTGSGQIFESDVIFNPAYTWTTDPAQAHSSSNTYYYPPVLMHELGHAWGMQITGETYDYDVPTVMHGIHKDVNQPWYTIHATDAQFIRDTYKGITTLPNTKDVAVFSHYVSGGDLKNSWPSSYSFTAGDSITINNLMIENTGKKALSNVRIRLHMSKGSVVKLSDPMIGEWVWSTYPSEHYGVFDFTGKVPANLTDGTYSIGAIVTRDFTKFDDVMYNDLAMLKSQVTVKAQPTGPGCQNDTMEPNNTMAQATTVYKTPGGAYHNLRICDGESDWFRIWLNQGERLDVTALFSHALGDLSLWMFDDLGTYYGGSTSSSDNESFTIPSASHSGYYLVHVNAIIGVDNQYSLALEVQQAPTAGGPTAFVAGDRLTGDIAQIGGQVEGTFAGAKGMKLVIDPAYIGPGLKAKVTLVDPTGAEVGSELFKKSNGDAESFKLKKSGTYTLRVTGKSGTTGPFELQTKRKLPKSMTKKSSKTLKPKGGAVQRNLTALPGTMLNVPVVRKKGTPDTLTASVRRPDGSYVDISTHYDFDGLSLVQVMLDQPGKYTIRYEGFPSKKNLLKVTLDPAVPPAGSSVVTLN